MDAGTTASPAWTRFVPRVACLIAFIAFSVHACLWIPRLTYGFAMYYTYARLALEGESLDRAYDDVYFNAKVREFGFDLQDQPNNPPTAALAYMPVAWLQPVLAKIVWSCVSLAALAYALKLLFEISGIRASGNAGLWLLTLVFLWHPAYDTVALGQVYFLLLLLFSLSMKGLMRERVAGTAIPLALALLVKGYGVVPALLLALRRRWKEFLIVVSIATLLIIVTLPLLGRKSWPAFFSTVLPSLGSQPSSAHVAYQTINSLLRHLFTFDPQWLPHPVFVLPGVLVTFLSYSISITVVVAVLLRSRLESGPEKFLSFSAAVAAGVVTAPLAE
ncbi:MAG TPA: glycosyltransferase family 87 protein, partial [Bacteroidota bacterium]